MVSEGLKPCPFCGGRDVTVFRETEHISGAEGLTFPHGKKTCLVRAMRCLDCGAKGPTAHECCGDTDHDISETWNRRAEADANSETLP